mmetsp:Transcript_42094/g.51062  ORF Transcript_42094/g.51062 Transcript_42094/m.51062 type:complete len:234 (-) Transcript_42094:526-1227(-)
MGAKEDIEAEKAALAAINGTEVKSTAAPAPSNPPANPSSGWGEDEIRKSKMPKNNSSPAQNTTAVDNTIGKRKSEAGAPMGTGKWTSELSNVFANGPSSCCCAFFLPWCFWGSTMNKFHADDMMMSSIILFAMDAPVLAGMYVTGGLFPLHSSSVMSCGGRYEIRQKYGINADLNSESNTKVMECLAFTGTMSDFYVHLFCLPCALIQERTFIEAQIAKHGAMVPPKMQDMGF